MSSSQTELVELGCASDVMAPIEIALLTGGFDKPYAFGLATALASHGVQLEIIGSDDVDCPEFHTHPNIRFLNLFKSSQKSLAGKLLRVLNYYARLLRYAATAKPKIFHILWNNKVQLFDRTLLMLYYKLCGKKLAFTAHNVNAGKRDGTDSLLNRFSLRTQYRLTDHIFVHTEKMKAELLADFGVLPEAVTVIPFGINNSVPNTALTSAEARRRLGIPATAKVILFFGSIRPYKGLEYLVKAFQQVAPAHQDYRLVIAGKAHSNPDPYLAEIKKTIEEHPSRKQIIQRTEFVPDEETELYFKAADVSVLPYTLIFQSGVLCLSYSFGTPVITSDVGSFREDIVEGTTGLLFRSSDIADLASTIERFFDSDLYRALNACRPQIQEYANLKYSWDVVAESTCRTYSDFLGRKR